MQPIASANYNCSPASAPETLWSKFPGGGHLGVAGGRHPRRPGGGLGSCAPLPDLSPWVPPSCCCQVHVAFVIKLGHSTSVSSARQAGGPSTRGGFSASPGRIASWSACRWPGLRVQCLWGGAASGGPALPPWVAVLLTAGLAAGLLPPPSGGTRADSERKGRELWGRDPAGPPSFQGPAPLNLGFASQPHGSLWSACVLLPESSDDRPTIPKDSG